MKSTLLLCLFVVMSGCSDSSAPPDNTPTYSGPIIPLQVGNWWAYHVKSYPGTGRVDESFDTIIVSSKNTVDGIDEYSIAEKSTGQNAFIWFYKGDTLYQRYSGNPMAGIAIIYPMTEGQEITIDSSKNVLRLDSIRTSLDLGFEKFYALKYSFRNPSGTLLFQWFEPGYGWLKQEFYNTSGNLLSSYELIGYHVNK